ncbi:fibrous sheath-interacting protein 1 isoform X2 [Clupea harengus]|nr:fibrous sheath-interacting protein 1 isoform X2 [Clupea harengus]XP_042565722.1 fibrous sheath-interacting protein 1 isoform X2 [Clupea harengus]
MDISRGGLENISRPASSERTRVGSRVSTASLAEGGRINRASPTSLEVLSSDTIEEQVLTMVLEAKSFAENIPEEDGPNERLPSDKETSQTDGSDDENEDPELKKAIKKMKRLDKILSQWISKEKEVKKKGRGLYQKLWQELEEHTARGGSKDAIENTNLFLALISSTSQESSEELDIVPVFGTQIPEKDYENNPSQERVEGESKKSDSAGPSEVDQEEDEEAKSDSRRTEDAMGKQTQDFVRKNIKLASSGQHVPMTLDEKQRLSELLQDIDDESEDNCSVADCEEETSLCSVSTRRGEGYTPEPSELDQLVQIDARLQTLLPHEDFLSVRSPYPDHNLPQVVVVPAEAETEAEAEGHLGEQVLQDMRERRGQEARLREIQQQLGTMERCQTESTGAPQLPEEQLQSLLLECELALSRAQNLGTRHPSPWGSSASEMEGDCSPPLLCTPRLSSAALSELLREFRVTSALATSLDSDTPTEEGECV